MLKPDDNRNTMLPIMHLIKENYNIVPARVNSVGKTEGRKT